MTQETQVDGQKLIRLTVLEDVTIVAPSASNYINTACPVPIWERGIFAQKNIYVLCEMMNEKAGSPKAPLSLYLPILEAKENK